MNFFNADNLLAHTAGRWLQRPDRPATLAGVGIDSRSDLAGKCFVAIKGEHHDGHDYLRQAVDAGADLLIVHHHPLERDLPPHVGVLQVDDTRAALGRLACAYRRQLRRTRVIAITGSAGKTTVKHLLDAVLSTSMRGSAAPRSYNNDIGVPLTILRTDPQDEYLIVEIGANRPGEIDQLAAMVQPDVAVITMIGRAHLGGFGSLETVAREKATLLRHMQSNALAVVNADSPHLRRHIHTAESLVLFGQADDADLRLTDWGADEGDWRFEVDGRDRFRLGLPGKHNALNALAVVAVARQLGITDRRIDAALGQCEPVEMRMSCHRIGDIIVYNDAYNANPDSVIAAVTTFAELAADATRRVLVLGDMLELGEAAPQLHREIGQFVVDLDRGAPIDHVILVGPLAQNLAAPIRGVWPANRLTLLSEMNAKTAAATAGLLQPGDTVLLKGSRAVALEQVMDAIKRQHEGGDVVAGAQRGGRPRREAMTSAPGVLDPPTLTPDS